MELNFVLEESHVLELANIRVPKFEAKKRSFRMKSLGRLRFNLGLLVLIYVAMLVTFWAVKLVTAYEADGTALFVGLFVGGAVVALLMAFRLRVLRNERVQKIAAQPQRCFLKVTPEMILLSRFGYDQVLAPKAVSAVTQHSTVLIIWHPYGNIAVPRSAFGEGKSETEFLNMVRGASGSTLN
jgi:hypothetical protein